MPPRENLDNDETTLEIVRLKRTGRTWKDVSAAVKLPVQTCRSRYRRWGERNAPPEILELTGIRPAEARPDEDEVYQRAVREWTRTSRIQSQREAQVLTFSRGPVALVNMADLHFGGEGVDYPRAFAEAEIVRDTPGMFCNLVGDIIDNFIIDTLVRAQFNSRIAVIDEWALVRRYLRILAPKLAVVVSGNHDAWISLLSGLDYFREVVGEIAPNVIYDAHDCSLTVRVGDVEWPGRIRHRWRGRSIYNPTHGIERAAKWDQGFVWAVASHTHECGVARGFNVGGRSGMALLCGSYKRIDDYARQQGYPRPNSSTAVTIVFDEETGSMTGFENLEMAARFMRALYDPED